MRLRSTFTNLRFETNDIGVDLLSREANLAIEGSLVSSESTFSSDTRCVDQDGLRQIANAELQFKLLDRDVAFLPDGEPKELSPAGSTLSHCNGSSESATGTTSVAPALSRVYILAVFD